MIFKRENNVEEGVRETGGGGADGERVNGRRERG